MSAEGIAQIAVVMGSRTAGGAYVPAMSDETIIVKNQGTIFLGRPAAGGQGRHRRGGQRRGPGGGDAHAPSGVPTTWPERPTRWASARGRRPTSTRPRSPPTARSRAREPAVRCAQELYGVIPDRHAQALTCARVIARIVDGSEFDEFKPRYGATLVTGFARIDGMPVGIVANNGILFSESRRRARTSSSCAPAQDPLVFLQNITGFMVGRKYENEGIAATAPRWSRRSPPPGAQVHRDHRRQLRRRQLRHVRPRLFSRASCGCGRTRASASWAASRPPACWRPCGATASRPEAARSADEEDAFKAPIRQQYEEQGHPYYATRAAVGRRHHRPGRHRRCWRLACRPA